MSKRGNVFFIADTHFFHKNIVKWAKARQHFVDDVEMSGWMINAWNKVVTPNDRVIIAGDFAFQSRFDVLGKLEGKITLVLGNHDYASKIDQILEHPHVKVCSSMEWAGGIITHIPVHPSQLEERWAFNIHGHLHEVTIPDDRYICVSAEQIGLVPISWADLKRKHPQLNTLRGK